jgi:hypothetical protein
MYKGLNSLRASMVLNTLSMLFPLSGGSISNEKAVVLEALMSSATVIVSSLV